MVLDRDMLTKRGLVAKLYISYFVLVILLLLVTSVILYQTGGKFNYSNLLIVNQSKALSYETALHKVEIMRRHKWCFPVIMFLASAKID